MSNDIGKKLKYLREKKNWSQLQVAKKLDIDNSVLSKIESGKRGVEVPLLEKFADLFEVSTDYILGRNATTSEEQGSLFFFDMEGLSDEEIEDIKRHIEYVKWKASQGRNDE
ncbi:helix-turn-helix domain-containing protein [Cytobacillus gottheilii]|uniref:helix-turn-helix domain-containing protein n=1 Tax=Cytobacillus gottheilii TaxID=859144 RepID=UPI0024953078|nr:helix-turn-helix transcriptional regulator [Cytobacillus gottheilii]